MLSAYIDIHCQLFDHVIHSKGGELRLSQSANGDGNSHPVNIPIYEGTSIVFRNDQLDHQV